MGQTFSLWTVVATLACASAFGAPVRVAGSMKGYELVANAKDDKTETSTRLYQVVAAAEQGYFIIQGLVPTERAEEWVPEFKKLTASFRRTNNEQAR